MIKNIISSDYFYLQSRGLWIPCFVPVPKKLTILHMKNQTECMGFQLCKLRQKSLMCSKACSRVGANWTLYSKLGQKKEVGALSRAGTVLRNYSIHLSPYIPALTASAFYITLQSLVSSEWSKA